MADLQRTDSIESVDFLDLDRLTLVGSGSEATEMIESEFRRLERDGKLLPEPLLTADKARFVLFPIKHNDVSSSALLPTVLRLNLLPSNLEPPPCSPPVTQHSQTARDDINQHPLTTPPFTPCTQIWEMYKKAEVRHKPPLSKGSALASQLPQVGRRPAVPPIS